MTTFTISDQALALEMSCLACFFWKIGLIDQRPVKIDNYAALFTDQMMVLTQRDLKMGLLFNRFHLIDKAQFNESSQRTVDSIQGKGRHPLQQTVVQLFHCRVICRPGQFGKYFQSLRCYPQILAAASLLEGSNLMEKSVTHNSLNPK